MAEKPFPTPEQLRQLLRYDPSTGQMVWCERSSSFFTRSRGMTAEQKSATWSSRHAGRPALDYIDPSHGYRRGNLLGRSAFAHRVAWAIYYGYWPKGQIDHINGNRTDNRIENLRDVSPTENSRNLRRPKDNTSGRIGVSFDRRAGLWEASICPGESKKKFLGYFPTLAEAAEARATAERALSYHPNHGRD